MPVQLWAISTLVLLTLVLPHPMSALESIRPVSAGGTTSVWSRITIERADAYSSLNERAIQDCLRPKRVDCFSIQQNFWISNSVGDLVLWAQNTIELANLGVTMYYGTFTFQVWNSSTLREPLLCKPEASREASCRAPFYTDPSPFPHSFTFYSHIAGQGSKYELLMSNDFGAVTWQFPASVKCPCHIGTVSEKPPPWGQSMFELVMVGLDNSAIAVFRNDTVGTFGPILVEFDDGSWHSANVSTLHCPISVLCAGLLATGEESMNLAWNSTDKEFHWSPAAFDQGVSISTLTEGAAAAPALPNPRPETFLYAEFRSLYAYLTILDSQRRPLGVDPESGKRVEAIPNSSITHNSSEDLLIVNPIGEYELVITAGGNTAFNLFVSKTSNTGRDLGTRHYNGSLNIGSSKHFHLDTENMSLSSQESASATSLFPVAGIVLALAGFIGIIAGILFLRRKRINE